MVVKTQASIFSASFLALITLFFTNFIAFADGPGENTGEIIASSNLLGTPQGQVSNYNRPFVPGDAVEVSTYPDTLFFLNAIYPIDDAGYIELPIHGKTRISQMNQLEFVNFLLDKYKDYLRFPNIQVKPMIRLSVLGGVPRPGFYYFDKDYSLWDVMKLVGGTMDEDGLKKIRWKRDGEVVEDNVIPFLQSGIALKNISFRSGDQIWVRSPNKPGFLEKSRSYMNFLTAAASFFTLYLTYQSVIVGRRNF